MAFFPLLIVWALLVHLNIALRNTDEKMYRWALHFTSSLPVQFNLGILLLETGRPEEALPYLENVRAAYPENANHTYVLAKAHWLSGHHMAAIQMLRDWTRNHPNDPRARQTLDKLRELSSQR